MAALPQFKKFPELPKFLDDAVPKKKKRVQKDPVAWVRSIPGGKVITRQ